MQMELQNSLLRGRRWRDIFWIMTDTRRTTAVALEAAIVAGSEAAIKSAAVDYLNAAKDAGALWAIERKRQMDSFPMNTDDWGAIMLAGRGATEGPRLWARHRAANQPIDDITRSEFLDLLHCRTAAGDFSPLPPTPGAEYHESVSEYELETYITLIGGIKRCDPKQVEYSLAQLKRNYDAGPIFIAGVRAVARKYGVDFSA